MEVRCMENPVVKIGDKVFSVEEVISELGYFVGLAKAQQTLVRLLALGLVGTTLAVVALSKKLKKQDESKED